MRESVAMAQGRHGRLAGVMGVAVALTVLLAVLGLAPGRAQADASRAPNLGPNVIVFNPSMSQASIQTKLNQIATQQVPNQFGTQRYSILFEPGTYGSASDPLAFQVGFYTQVAGLGANPGDVTINGAIDVFNQCVPGGQCDGTDNFWRSLSNLTLNFDAPTTAPVPDPGEGGGTGCEDGNEYWAVSQAAPMRRVIVNGNLALQDFCGEGFVSGGFLSDDEFNGGAVINAGQQQFFTRNSNIDSWTNSVWNQVFLGDNGAPATDFGTDGTQYTTLPSTPVSEEEPFMTDDGHGHQAVFVPAVRRNSVGPSYANGPEAGQSIPLDRFFIANPSTPVSQINDALDRGQNLIFTPGVYDLRQTIEVTRPDTVVLGLGFATLVPQTGRPAMVTGNVPGIKLSGLLFDAGLVNSPVLLQVGTCVNQNGHGSGGPGCGGQGTQDPRDPTLLSDVFFRVGGATPGKATTSLVVDDDNAILDDVWAWRADHGNGVGWTQNTGDTGVVVNGDNVDAYGLFVEHYQKFEVVWNGENGEDVFFQNELPYDPPSQAAWMSAPTTDGYAAFLVSPKVKTFQGYGMGSYSFFDQGIPIMAAQSFQAPRTPGVQFHDLLTVFLNPTTGSGGIDSVIDGVGGSSTAANPSTPVDVTSFP
jgi:hypothetical protein